MDAFIPFRDSFTFSQAALENTGDRVMVGEIMTVGLYLGRQLGHIIPQIGLIDDT